MRFEHTRQLKSAMGVRLRLKVDLTTASLLSDPSFTVYREYRALQELAYGDMRPGAQPDRCAQWLRASSGLIDGDSEHLSFYRGMLEYQERCAMLLGYSAKAFTDFQLLAQDQAASPLLNGRLPGTWYGTAMLMNAELAAQYNRGDLVRRALAEVVSNEPRLGRLVTGENLRIRSLGPTCDTAERPRVLTNATHARNTYDHHAKAAGGSLAESLSAFRNSSRSQPPH